MGPVSPPAFPGCCGRVLDLPLKRYLGMAASTPIARGPGNLQLALVMETWNLVPHEHQLVVWCGSVGSHGFMVANHDASGQSCKPLMASLKGLDAQGNSWQRMYFGNWVWVETYKRHRCVDVLCAAVVKYEQCSQGKRLGCRWPLGTHKQKSQMFAVCIQVLMRWPGLKSCLSVAQSLEVSKCA